MMFLWFALLLLFPLAMVLMMRGGMDHGTHSPRLPGTNPDLMEAARVRLARGEITGEQYDAIRRALVGEL